MPSQTYRSQKTILLFIFLVTIINYLDRAAIAFAILPVQKAFNLSNSEFGFIASSFGIGYLISCFFSGLIADRFSAAKIWGYFAIFWSIITAATALCTGFWSLMAMRFLLGVAEAIHFPALLRTIADWLDPKYRAKCIALGLLGVPVSAIIGAPFLSLLIDIIGWRWMFITLGIIGVVWGIIWLSYIWRIPSHHRYVISDDKKMSEQASGEGSWAHLLRSRALWGNCINFGVFGYIVFFTLIWLPGYIEKTFHTNIMKTGLLVALPWLFAAISVVFGGWLSDSIKRKTHSIKLSRIYPVGIGLLLSGISFFFVGMTTNLGLATFLLILGLSFAFFTNAPIFSLNADLFKRRAGGAQGIITLFFSISGIIAPTVTGILSELFGSFKTAFFLTAILCLGAFIFSFFLQRVPEKTE